LNLQHIEGSRKMLGRIAGDDMPHDLLDSLASAVEPIKEYNREKTQVYDVEAPLNHLVDAVPPESNEARHFNELALRAIHDPSVRPQLRTWLTKWRGNDALIEPYLATSALRQPLVPLSKNLSSLAGVGLAALDVIDSAQSVTAEKQKEQLTEVDMHDVSSAEMLIAITSGIRELVKAEPISQ
jgi:hexosaminidase